MATLKTKFYLPLFLLLIITRGNLWVSYLYENWGYIVFNKYATLQSDEPNFQKLVYAQTFFEKAIHYDSQRLSTWRVLGFVQRLQGANDLALSSWRLIGGMGDELIEWGIKSEALGDLDAAQTWFEKAVELEPNLAEAYYHLGRMYETKGDWNKAIVYYETAVSKPNAPLREIYCAIGWTFHWHSEPRQPRKALDYYNLALTDTPTIEAMGCQFKRAELLLWYLNEPEKAAQDYAIISDFQPTNVQVLANLIFARYQRSKDFITAEKELLQLIQTYPQNQWSYWRLGDLYRVVGQYENAIQMYEKVLELEPDNQQMPLNIQDLRNIDG